MSVMPVFTNQVFIVSTCGLDSHSSTMRRTAGPDRLEYSKPTPRTSLSMVSDVTQVVSTSWSVGLAGVSARSTSSGSHSVAARKFRIVRAACSDTTWCWIYALHAKWWLLGPGAVLVNKRLPGLRLVLLISKSKALICGTCGVALFRSSVQGLR